MRLQNTFYNNSVRVTAVLFSTKKEEKPKLSRPERIYMTVLSNLKNKNK